MTALSISAAFDGGNIQVLDASNAAHVRLAIRPDNASDFYQWFYYRVTGGRGQALKMVIENAKDAAYVGGWDGYHACASYDRETWFRVDTDYIDGQLVINHTPEVDSVYYAYFAPYSMERHADLIAEVGIHPDAVVDVLGHSVQGQTIDRVTIGSGPQVLWVIARQHPGETMAEWWAEGFLARLLDDDDPVSRVLRSKATFHVVPNMNPDGSKNGNLRTNKTGANLNREWGVSTIQNSPEVYYVTRAMNESRPNMVLDVHGDETLPYNFIAGGEGAVGYSEKQARDKAAFTNAYEMISPDFQTMHGYDVDAPGTANMTVCTNWIAGEYGCLSMTLEMPFKDNADLPDEEFGWSPERCAKLGASALDAMLAVVDDL